MKLLSMGKFVQKTNYRENAQDYKTWTEMSNYFEKIYLIVLSPDKEWHHQECEKLDITWIPKVTKPLEFIYFTYASYRKGLELVRDNGIDVLNVGEPLGAGLAALGIKKKFKKPLVVQIQGQLFNLPKTYNWLRRVLVKGIAKFVTKRADRVRVVSEEIKKTVVENGIEEKKVFVSPSRCDTEQFNPKRYITDVAQIKSTLGYDDDDIVIVFVGRLVVGKDVSSVLKALSKVVKRYQNIRFLIVGDGDVRESLEQETRDLSLTNYVSFYGAVNYDEVPKMLAVGDIFVSPSWDEGMPRAVLEAMSMGLATIVTPVGGNPEIIDDGENGYFVDVKAPEQIAEKILLLLDNSSLLEEVRANARKKIVEKYEMKKCIESFAKIHFL